MTPSVRYPSGPITKHGAAMFLKGEHPMVALRSYDDTVAIHLMGGLAIPYRTSPESVQIKKNGIRGLIPPWRLIDQKGATEDGVTNLDTLYDPIEVELDAICYGRDPQHTRQVVRDLIASIDATQKSELSWTTFELGRWWANVRWNKPPPNPIVGAQGCRQELQLRLRADDGFWRSYDDVDMFSFDYASMSDTFDVDYGKSLGPAWPQRYIGSKKGGICVADGTGQARWYDQAGFMTEGREVVNGPYRNFVTQSDNQTIESHLGSIAEISFPDGAENHIWGRMGRNPDGSWNGYGIKAQIGWGGILLSRFNAFVETPMRYWPMVVPPLFNEKFTLVCGYEGKPRTFKVLRNGFELFTHLEVGTGSALGPAYRGVGFGMRAGAALVTQATPATVRKIAAGDNMTVAQSGYLRRINVGDQPFWDRYTIFGPASNVRIGNGPNTTDYVEFGPVLPGQVVQLRTDPRKRGIVDLTAKQPTPQELALFQKAHDDYASFATANNAPVLLKQLESVFGKVPPQANLYRYLRGSFNKPIPPKPAGKPPTPYYVSVSIDGGNSDSKVIAAGTPLRRYPQ